MLFTDASGLDVTSISADAITAWNRTVGQFLSHDRHTPDALAETLAEDENFALAWCAKGFFLALLVRDELASPAQEALARAEASIGARGSTARERLYLKALRSATQRSFSGAIAALEAILHANPRDSLAAKLSHSFSFMLGDARAMRESIERVVARAGLDHPHLGYMLGCLAFALEETGAYRDAERLGARAIEITPRDAWGLQAVIHVHEMTGRPKRGADYLAPRLDSFGHCNNFGYHLLWHLALFRLELGDLDGALRLYDDRIRSERTDDFRDVANAVSLLARFELAGADVGSRWNELGSIAERRITDRSLVFASLH
jgi:tetratricopeptide (TPR) repeat protein